ncbi:hypothetical protein FF011L_17420 [Roseimaritima multifibrata]|uniref:Uncharacterized protein n=1 Tax=Roseimaritima multifibrata TaxID=1930274 RepID=A0A517MDY0_9BACT|nr:hypothetical protein FF011L_17420 [Roseimaritima multifibrata]
MIDGLGWARLPHPFAKLVGKVVHLVLLARGDAGDFRRASDCDLFLLWLGEMCS